MIIQHNIMAMNSYRHLGNNSAALSGNLEKLSSGYKINRAGDDAAGLAISEKMRAQITGLDAAQQNVKDTISLVQTAEGALQEVQDMLNRMVYLATESANGTYDDEVDRAALQDEVDALKTEIDRIADSANFNGIHLLDGCLGSRATVDGATVNGIKDIVVMGGGASAQTQNAETITAVLSEAGALTVQTEEVAGVSWEYTVDGTTTKVASGTDITINGAADVDTGGSITFKAVVDPTVTDALAEDLDFFEGMTMTVVMDSAIPSGDDAGKWATDEATATIGAPTGLTLQIGDTSDSYNQLTVSIEDMHVKALGISGVSVATLSSAQDAITSIKAAINSVSSTRGGLGAIQNRLEHTMNNLEVMEENIQDAESTIRDTDIAEEMMAYTKNNILIQSSQAMLAQANQVPQGVLQLMQ